MMFYFIVGFCVILLTVALLEFLAAKTRLVDRQIDDIIAKRLKTYNEERNMEILALREACGVMRNLLLDIAENESSLDRVDDRTPADLRTKLISNRDTRRRELCAELNAVLGR